MYNLFRDDHSSSLQKVQQLILQKFPHCGDQLAVIDCMKRETVASVMTTAQRVLSEMCSENTMVDFDGEFFIEYMRQLAVQGANDIIIDCLSRLLQRVEAEENASNASSSVAATSSTATSASSVAGSPMDISSPLSSVGSPMIR
jgi:hypothetical protein